MKGLLKKGLALSLIFAFAASTMAGCGDGGKGSGGAVSIENGKFVEPVTITHAVAADSAQKFGEGQSYDKNVWTDYIEEQLGIKLEVAWSADNGTEAYGNKLTMGIANGDLPDIFTAYYSTYAEAANEGLLADMTDLIEEYGSDRLKAIFEANADLIDACRIDGKLYCIPALSVASEVNTQFLWIRQDWLDAVHMSAPTTWDELVAVARAFTTQDPDGNGQNDTYGIGLSGTSPWWGGVASFEGFAAAFHAVGSQNWIKDADGKIVYGGVQPEMKEALAAAAQLYQEGILDPEFNTKDVDAVIADVYSNKIGMLFGMNYAGYWPLGAVVEENPDAVWKPYAFVSADSTPASCSTWWPLDQYTCVAASCENPAAAVLIANLYVETLNDETPAEISAIYDYAGDVSAYMLCPVRLSSGTTELDTYRKIKAISEGTLSYEDLEGKYKSNYDAVQAYLDGDVGQYGYWSQLGIGGCIGVVVDEYIPGNRVILTEIHGGFPTEVSGDMGMIQSKEVEYYAKIISGVLPVDAFEDWLAEFETLGGSHVTEVVNETFNH